MYKKCLRASSSLFKASMLSTNTSLERSSALQTQIHSWIGKAKTKNKTQIQTKKHLSGWIIWPTDTNQLLFICFVWQLHLLSSFMLHFASGTTSTKKRNQAKTKAQTNPARRDHLPNYIYRAHTANAFVSISVHVTYFARNHLATDVMKYNNFELTDLVNPKR